MRTPAFSLLAAALLLPSLASSSFACDKRKCEEDNYDEKMGMTMGCKPIPGCTPESVTDEVSPAPVNGGVNQLKLKQFPVGTGDEHGGIDGKGSGVTSLPSGSTLPEKEAKKVQGKEPVKTEDTVPTSTLIDEIQKDAKEKIKDKPRFASVIQGTADGVCESLKKQYPEKIPAANMGTYGPMLDIQLDKNREMWLLRKRNPPLNARDRKEEEKRIIAEYNTRMKKEAPGAEVMASFHAKFSEVWEDWKQHRPPKEQNDWSGGGLPPSGHIGDMIKDNPKNPSNWTLDGQDKLASGDKEGGRASLDRAIALGGTPDAYAIRGGMRLDAKDYDGAYTDAKKALELNPDDKNAMGLLKSAEGRTSPGLAESLAAGGSGGAGGAGSGAGAGGGGYGGGSQEGFGAPMVSGGARQLAGMTTAAAIASSQKLDDARRAMSLGDSTAAIALAQRALEQNPGNAAAHSFLSAVYARKGDYKRAIASASAGLAIAPRDGALLNNKAFAENRSKLYKDALASANGAIEADSRNAYSYANRAHAYGGLGDKEAMMSDIERAAKLDPRFQQAAADAAQLQLPSNADILFMFPGENPEPAAAAPAPARGKSTGIVLGAGLVGGLLLALGLLSTVLAPLKESVVSAFTKATRRGPSVGSAEEEPAAAAPVSAAGLIRGQYEISRQIGAGGMGTVYEGTDRSLGRRVAIKKMRDDLRLNPRDRERFVIEAKTVASLHHPNIVDIYAIAEEGEDVYLVFEYVDGQTVHDAVQASGRLTPAEALVVTRAMGEALTYAHSKGVIHRDMKPSNVMLTGDGRVKVMDFGIARMAKDAMTRYSMTNTVVGTPPYMAPEQEQGVVRKESDVYALAICAYEMLTGKLPFIGMGAGMLMNKINMSYVPPSRAIAGLPEPLDPVFAKAFQSDPEQRYRSPQEFAAALEAAFGGARSSMTPS